MNKLFFVAFIILAGWNSGFSQKYFSKTGHISFYSETKLEKFDAHNKSASIVYDSQSGKLESAALVKGFQFERALMQEHFNENYMESSKYPKATFKGMIDNYKTVDLTKNGKYNVKISGDLTMHGVTQKVATDGQIVVNNGKIEATSAFNVALADYKITIPALVKDQISKTVKITITSNLELLKQ